jgi:hypothetical protein
VLSKETLDDNDSKIVAAVKLTLDEAIPSCAKTGKAAGTRYDGRGETKTLDVSRGRRGRMDPPKAAGRD